MGGVRVEGEARRADPPCALPTDGVNSKINFNEIRVDKVMDTLFSGPGIYTLVFTSAQKRLSVIVLLVTGLTFGLQVLTPINFLLAMDKTVTECPGASADWIQDGDGHIRIACFLFSSYLVSQVASVLDRALAMFLIADMVDCPRRSAHILGAIVLLASSVMTVLVTYGLFIESPEISEMLQNCIALTFITTVDQATILCCNVMTHRDVDIMEMRMDKLQEAWEDSTEREKLVREGFHNASLRGNVFRAALFLTKCWMTVVPILNAICIAG